MAGSTPEQSKDMPEHRFADIYERHASMLYRVCFSYMKNAADTEDIVSDVFVKLISRDVRFQSSEHEKAWLLRIAINLCKDTLKHWWRRRESIDDYYGLESKEHFYEDDALRAVMELPERLKAATYLYYYEGYNTAEISNILRKPQSTILYHLHIARKLLKEVLGNEE